MKLFKRSRKSEGESSETADGRRSGRKVSDEGTTIFAFKAYTSEAAAFSTFGNTVALGAKDPTARIRKEAGKPKANVVVVEPSDWDAPSISSLAQPDIVAAFPRVATEASAALSRAFGVGPLGSSQLVDHGVGAMPHPAGHILFLFAIPGQYEWAGEGEPGA